MVPLSEKLARECAPGTLILSYRFMIPLASNEKESFDAASDALLSADVIYDHEEMRIYQVKEASHDEP